MTRYFWNKVPLENLTHAELLHAAQFICEKAKALGLFPLPYYDKKPHMRDYFREEFTAKHMNDTSATLRLHAPPPDEQPDARAHDRTAYRIIEQQRWDIDEAIDNLRRKLEEQRRVPAWWPFRKRNV